MEPIRNKIFNEDCLETLHRKDLMYDTVVCSPPDFAELGIDNPSINKFLYQGFLEKIFWKLKPKNGLITVIVSDRLADGQVITKHQLICGIFDRMGYIPYKQKIWVRDDEPKSKGGLFRLPYTFCYIFANTRQEYRKIKDFQHVIFGAPKKIEGYGDAYPVNMIKQFILACSNQNDIVYDPFMGSGTTALACMDTYRSYVGSEIDKKTFKLSRERIKSWENYLV